MAKQKKGKRGRTNAKPGSTTDVPIILKRFLKTYENHCAEVQSIVSPTIKQNIQLCIENERIMTKIMLTFPEDSLGETIPKSVQPLLMTIRDERYMLGKELCIWNVVLNNQDIADLYPTHACLTTSTTQRNWVPKFPCPVSIILEKRGRTYYPFSHLELLDCGIDAWSLERLGKAVNFSSLTSLNLDYNEFGEEGVRGLLNALEGNNHVVSLSLCYCKLGPGSGSLLAALVTKSAIRDLYVNGNELQSEGAIALVTEMAEYAENMASAKQSQHVEELGRQSYSAPSRLETRTGSAMKKKKKKKGKKRKIAKPPEIGPWLEKLHLADNAIDGCGKAGITSPLKFTHVLCQLIRFSDHLTELDLDDNGIGELCGKLVLDALKERKEAKLACLKVKVTSQMSADTFASILKNTKKLASKKKRKKKKK
ncbi:uncharacterized protein LOC136753490 isoform X1 [Amia ocellicauda]|uniref:uncharacterized protein LOC136753490 isoform X1 n=1 Tax=Amia ocellicauda TaxID=2972642 RepID=UPI003463886F